MSQVDSDLVRHCLSRVGGRPGCPIMMERNAAMMEDCDGFSPLDGFKEKLDTAIDFLMDSDLKKKERIRLKEQARVLTHVIAVLENPYRVDDERVSDEAMERYEERHAG